MVRSTIKLCRRPGSLLDILPIADVAVAYLQSVEGVTNIEIERSNLLQIELTYLWHGSGDPVIPLDTIDRYGLSVC
ncbi:hypothetical protein [Pseudomonas sp. CGJS7]|uniref:hypothetical protein n=1 Tax=Pseudomonas sp. CGJS7 TaxID=3109348 RepID=UPI00300AEE46